MFGVKENIEIKYKNGQIKIIEITKYNKIITYLKNKIENNTFSFFIIVLPFTIIKGISYSIYLKIKSLFK